MRVGVVVVVLVRAPAHPGPAAHPAAHPSHAAPAPAAALSPAPLTAFALAAPAPRRWPRRSLRGDDDAGRDRVEAERLPDEVAQRDDELARVDGTPRRELPRGRRGEPHLV